MLAVPSNDCASSLLPSVDPFSIKTISAAPCFAQAKLTDDSARERNVTLFLIGTITETRGFIRCLADEDLTSTQSRRKWNRRMRSSVAEPFHAHTKWSCPTSHDVNVYRENGMMPDHSEDRNVGAHDSLRPKVNLM
jgi:hypothetical protein